MSDHSSSSAPGDTTPSGTGSSGPRTSGVGSTPGQGFFDWLRRLGVSRGDSWFGGVCGGLAARLGIDPIIVRGIAVVVALLGGPAFLLYALAWLLLPDAAGTIHLERLIRGTFDAATAGVIVFALLAVLPIAQGVWWAAGWPFGSAGGWTLTVGKLFWSAIVIAAIVLLVVWISRRQGGWGASNWAGSGYNRTATDPASPETSASGAGAGASASGPWAAPASGGDDSGATALGMGFSGSSSASGPGTPGTQSAPSAAGTPAAPTAPPPPSGNASPDALADWKARQAEWRVRYEEWKRQQSDDARRRRQQRSAAATAEASRRQAEAFALARTRRMTHPRTSGAYVAIALGAALIVGAIAAASSWSLPSAHHFQAAFGFAAATGVIGLSMLIAGLMRRRSGFLTFVAIVLTVVTVLLLVGVNHEIDVRLPGSFTSFHF